MPANIRKGSYPVVLVVAAVAILSADGHPSSRDNSVERYATRQGNLIRVHPSEVTFQVPATWRQHAWFFLTAREVRKAARVRGFEIVDAALNWRDCAAQIETLNLRWLRADVVDGAEGEILTRIQEKGRAAATKMPHYVNYDGHVTRWGASLYEFKMTPMKEGSWEHVDIPYTLDFGDYYGDGYISFYVRPVAGRELVLAVGFFATDAGPPDERQDLLKSVIVPGSADAVPLHI
jgi:hypothetical protein